MAFTMLTLKPEVLDGFALPQLPMPIRVERLPGILLRETVSTTQLLEELLLWLPENPAAREQYLPVVARLGLLAGVSEGNAGNLEDALRFFRTGLEAKPDDMQMLLNYGVALRQSGNPAEALKVFERAIRLLDGKAISPELWRDAAQLHFQLGNYPQALALVEQVLKVAPEKVANAEEFAAEIRKRIATPVAV